MASLAVKFNNRIGFGIRKSVGIGYANIQIIAVVFMMVFVVLIARQLSLITWQMLPSPTSLVAGNNNSSHVTPNVAPVQQSNLRSTLQDLYLFGRPPVAAPVVAQPVNVPVSRMAARITGLVASTDLQHSFVILRQGSASNTYRIGEQLKNSRFFVDSIQADRVIIRDGSKYESLLMYPDEASKTTTSVVETSTPTRVLSSTPIGSMHRIATGSPENLAEIISISPAVGGYTINPSRDRTYFDLLGLKPNDKAIAINGYDLTDPVAAMEVLSQLATLKRASLTVIRDGQRLDIDLSS